MKVVIISDIHDNLENLNMVLDFCREKKIDTILCTGDVTNIDTVRFLSGNFPRTIHMIRGNADSFEDAEVDNFANIEFYGRIALVEIGEYMVGMCHEPYLIPKVLDDPCDLVFYGHTHKPWIEKKDGVQTINPGTLGGMFARGTFAFWNTESGELKLRLVESIK